ncbi:MAG: puuD [Proteobacteria bacterium]|nr:puuD [Pseudomonadota bacterium]
MTAPVVLFTADTRDFDGYTWHCAPSTYLEAVLAVSGGMPLILSAFGSRLDLDAVLDRVDGVVATGSRTNVHPSHYGVTATEAMGPFDEVRDATSLPLIRRAIERGIPLLCICRGLQELNVALGGSLASDIQDQPDRMDHRHPDVADMDGKFAIRHGVTIVAGGCLGRIVEGEIQVNSLHRQAVARLSDRLAVEATAPDGTIEAVSVKGAAGFTLGVQWHPEYWGAADGPSKAILEAFGAAIVAEAAKR